MSIFPTKVLLATDGSPDAELALTSAVDLANSTSSELHVVTVAPGYPAYDVRDPVVIEDLRQRAEEILEEQTGKIEQAGGKVAEKYLRVTSSWAAEGSEG
jgi:nucleotide-binding universal stress UspA family protein